MGSFKPPERLWRSAMGTVKTYASRVGVARDETIIRENSTAFALFIEPQYALWQFNYVVNFRKLNSKN